MVPGRLDCTKAGSIWDAFRIGGEAGVRLDGGFETAALLRADYLTYDLANFQIHLGYQFRWYAQGYSPNPHPVSPTTN